jgi:hypothetical protein
MKTPADDVLSVEEGQNGLLCPVARCGARLLRVSVTTPRHACVGHRFRRSGSENSLHVRKGPLAAALIASPVGRARLRHCCKSPIPSCSIP